MEHKNVRKDGSMDRELSKDSVEISRELADNRNEYLEMNNLKKHENKIKKGRK